MKCNLNNLPFVLACFWTFSVSLSYAIFFNHNYNHGLKEACMSANLNTVPHIHCKNSNGLYFYTSTMYNISIGLNFKLYFLGLWSLYWSNK